MLERYHKEGLEFPCVKEEPVEEAGGNPRPSTSLSRKREIRGFEEEGHRGPIGPDSRLATGTLMVGQGRREEGEEETQASRRRVSTGGHLLSAAGLANLRLRIQQQIRKNENKSP